MTTDATDFLPNLLDLEVMIRRQAPAGYHVQFTLDYDQPFPTGALSSAVLPWLGTGSARDEAQRVKAWFYADPRLHAAWTAIHTKNFLAADGAMPIDIRSNHKERGNDRRIALLQRCQR